LTGWLLVFGFRRIFGLTSKETADDICTRNCMDDVTAFLSKRELGIVCVYWKGFAVVERGVAYWLLDQFLQVTGRNGVSQLYAWG